LDKESLPPYLRKLLRMNPAAIKKAYHEEQKKKWKQEWRDSARGWKTARFDNSTPSKRFVLAISKEGISRNAASRIAQFRLNHTPVNHYLKKIGKVDSAKCPMCGAEEEMIEHLLLLCPSYAHERWALSQQAKKRSKHLTLETLLGDQHMIKPLANYIEVTHRFTKAGEQTTHSR